MVREMHKKLVDQEVVALVVLLMHRPLILEQLDKDITEVQVAPRQKPVAVVVELEALELLHQDHTVVLEVLV
jgi:hypothetical protein